MSWTVNVYLIAFQQNIGYENDVESFSNMSKAWIKASIYEYIYIYIQIGRTDGKEKLPIGNANT